MNVRQLQPLHLEAFLQDEPETILLDVREPWEHQLAVLGNSRLISLGSLAERAEDELPEKDAPIVVYCHHGIRSLHACAYLASVGYSNLLNLTGGIDLYTREVDPSIPNY